MLDIVTPGKRDLEKLYGELEDVLEGPSWHGPLASRRVLFVGDTHGAPEVSRYALKLWDSVGGIIVFMGDYVDRGRRGLENLYLLLRAKLEWPDKVFLIRGNHESRMMNAWYGFLDELEEKGKTELYGVILDFYGRLPYMLRVNRWFVAHGGIACRKCVRGFDPPLTISEMLEEIPADPAVHREDPPTNVAMQVLWNDPRPQKYYFAPSIRGAGIFYYGLPAVRRFLEDNGLDIIIRAHERSDALRLMSPQGDLVEGPPDDSMFSEEELNGYVVTVFSSRYHGAGTGVFIYEEGVFRLHRLENRLD